MGPRLPGCRQRWYHALATAAAAAGGNDSDLLPPPSASAEYAEMDEAEYWDGGWSDGRGVAGGRRAGRKWHAAMMPLPVWTWAWRAGSQGDK